MAALSLFVSLVLFTTCSANTTAVPKPVNNCNCHCSLQPSRIEKKEAGCANETALETYMKNLKMEMKALLSHLYKSEVVHVKLPQLVSVINYLYITSIDIGNN